MQERLAAREAYWDGLKGIAIIAVIVIHSYRPDPLSGYSVDAIVSVLLRQLSGFAVALFLFLSGLMAGMSSRPKDSQYILQRIMGIWPTYLLWTVVFIMIFSPEDLEVPRRLFLDVFAGEGIGIGYFVIVLTQMIVLTPIIARIQSIAAHVVIMVLFSAAGLVFTYYAKFGPYPALGTFPYAGLPFFVWYPFYHLGFVLAKNLGFNKKRQIWLAIAAAAACLTFLCNVAEGFLYFQASPDFAVSQLKVSSVAFSLTVCSLAVLGFPYLREFVPQWLAWIGCNSLVIYLAHLIPLRLIFWVAEKGGMNPGTMQLLVVSMTTLGICLVGVYIGRSILPRKIAAYAMG